MLYLLYVNLSSLEVTSTPPLYAHITNNRFLADPTNGRVYATVLRPSVVCGVKYCA